MYSTTNKKVLGKMKDECGGRSVADFVSLHLKLYSILKAGGANTRKATVAKEIRHAIYHGMNVLRSVGHQIYVQHITRVSLSPLDMKRWIAPVVIETRAYVHCQTHAENNAALDALVDELFA